MMDCIREFEDMVMKEVENVVNKGDLTPADVKNIGEAVDVVKDLYTIMAMKEPQGGYSQGAPGWYGNSYGRWMTPEERYTRGGYSGMYYDNATHGRSYDDRPRDNMGRYTNQEGYENEGYSGRRYR